MNSKKLLARKIDSSTLEAVHTPALDLKREEGFTLKYANHVSTEPTGWDLKVIFGRIDPSVSPNTIIQHTAVSLPWPTIKSLIYVLRVQLTAYEKNVGHVPFPMGGMNPVPRSVPSEFSKLPNAQAIHEAVLKLYDEFVADNPEGFQEKHGGD